MVVREPFIKNHLVYEPNQPLNPTETKRCTTQSCVHKVALHKRSQKVTIDNYSL